MLAKGTDGIWHRGAIVSVITDDTKCVVKFESVYQPVRTLDIHEVLPLVGGAGKFNFYYNYLICNNYLII